MEYPSRTAHVVTTEKRTHRRRRREETTVPGFLPPSTPNSDEKICVCISSCNISRITISILHSHRHHCSSSPPCRSHSRANESEEEPIYPRPEEETTVVKVTGQATGGPQSSQYPIGRSEGGGGWGACCRCRTCGRSTGGRTASREKKTS